MNIEPHTDCESTRIRHAGGKEDPLEEPCLFSQRVKALPLQTFYE